MPCEFCDEFRHPFNSRFAQIYAPLVKNRVVAQRGNLVAMPTIGQLFPGSLLVMPMSHVETMASLPESALLDLSTFITDLEMVIGQNSPVIAFEHGARCITGGGCGVYHAHLHLVPVPTPVSIDDLLPNKEDLQFSKLATSISTGLQSLMSSPEYLLFRDCDYRVRFLELSTLSHKRYPSQYFRRALAELFNLDRSWDWRTYQEPEQYLFETINMFRDANVSLCK
ncbi:hypothetical protein ES703_64314 [subsurface metagenome]